MLEHEKANRNLSDVPNYISYGGALGIGCGRVAVGAKPRDVPDWAKVDLFDYHGHFIKTINEGGAWLGAQICIEDGMIIITAKDYFHIYDYWKWDQNLTDKTLAMYDWELAPDTNTTWRIGDGTAAFYNYIYKQVAGFTEHDTFRSNQIREGDISRKEAIELVKDENRPRYQNIRWYLDTINMDFEDTIKTINSIPKLYKTN